MGMLLKVGDAFVDPGEVVAITEHRDDDGVTIDGQCNIWLRLDREAVGASVYPQDAADVINAWWQGHK